MVDRIGDESKMLERGGGGGGCEVTGCTGYVGCVGWPACKPVGYLSSIHLIDMYADGRRNLG